MAKQNNYPVSNPDETRVESKKERQARERREKKFRQAAFRLTDEQRQISQENPRRHAEFDDKRRAGGRQAQRRRAIRDSREDK